MAIKRPSPEHFAQPARKCRRKIKYTAQQNDVEGESSSRDDSGSEYEAVEKVKASDAEDETDHEYKDTTPSTKRIAHTANKARDGSSRKQIARTASKVTSPSKRILRAVNKAPNAIRKDSAISNNHWRQVETSRSRSTSASTLAEDKPWVPLTELQKRPDRRRAEDRPWVPLFGYIKRPVRSRAEDAPWVPLFPSPPASAEKLRGDDGEGEGDSDDDDNDVDDDYNEDGDDMIDSINHTLLQSPSSASWILKTQTTPLISAVAWKTYLMTRVTTTTVIERFCSMRNLSLTAASTRAKTTQMRMMYSTHASVRHFDDRLSKFE